MTATDEWDDLQARGGHVYDDPVEPVSNRLDLGRLLRDGPPDPEWLIEPIVPAKRTTILTASAKVGKSLLSLDAVVNAVLGRRWLGEQNRPLRVLYIDYEMTDSDVAERLPDTGAGADDATELEAGLFYYQYPPLGPLTTDAGGSRLTQLATLHAVDLVVIDTWSRVIGDMAENDAATYIAYGNCTNARLKARGIATLINDHTGHDGDRSRGSSAKADLADLIWSARRTDDGIRLKRTHQRIGWAPEEVVLHRAEPGEGGPIHRRVGGGWPEGTAAKANELDRLEVPVDVTVANARKLAKQTDPGFTSKNNVLAAAVKYRRQNVRLTIVRDSEPGGEQPGERDFDASGGTPGNDLDPEPF